MSPPTVAPDLDRGRTIGKYEILTRLSIGGMAELFLAFIPGPGGFRKFVALKQILPDIKADESFVKMFLDEARITAAFSHSNIGQVYDLGEDHGELYLAMEFISGQNLEQIIKRAARREYLLPIGFSCRVVRDACLALHYAHHFTDAAGRPAPVVHRDVSPKNVMVTYTGDVKMIDFGIAKAKNRLNRTQVGIVKGTSGYMSPEQVKGEQLDGRTDLFAAAVMLHELLTGQRLFTASNDAAMMLKIAQADVPHPKSLNPKVPDALDAVVMKALSRKKEDRYATGKELAKAIDQACGEMAEEELLAQIMSELFDDKIQTTRALLELANADDTGGMTKAVEQLVEKEESEETTPRGRKGPAKATPAPRPGLAKKPPPGPPSKRTLPSVDETLAPKSRSPSNRNLNGDSSPPRRGSGPQPAARRAKATSYDAEELSAGESSTDQTPELKSRDTDTHPPLRNRAAPGAKKGGGGLVLTLVVLLLLGGVGAGIYKGVGPLAQVRDAIEKEIKGEPPPPPPLTLEEQAKLAAKGPKPKFVQEKEEADRRAAEERKKQQEIEAAQNDPERQKYLAELDSQIKELDRLEAEQEKLKADAKASKQAGAENTKRIDELEKQIADLKSGIDAKKKQAAKTKATEEGVQVVRDKKSAEAHDVGYLSLRTINPSSTAVWDGETSLGSTPLAKVPMDEGVHRLRVVDGESKNRLLSVSVKGGQTLELKAVDVSTLPLMQ